VTERLKRNGFSLFLQLLPIAGITRPNPTAAFTIMAPTDEVHSCNHCQQQLQQQQQQQQQQHCVSGQQQQHRMSSSTCHDMQQQSSIRLLLSLCALLHVMCSTQCLLQPFAIAIEARLVRDMLVCSQ
jgi:hypothetical protein